MSTPGDETRIPEDINGYRFEMFVFDEFPLAHRWTVMEVERDDEFTLVKNAPGSSSDSTEHARAMLSAQAKRFGG